VRAAVLLRISARIVVSAVTLLGLIRAHGTPTERADRLDHALPTLRGLQAAIDGGAATDMQALFPEGFVFTHAVSALAWLALAEREDLRSESLGHARGALAALESDEGREPFSAEMEPAYGVFHAGWTNLVRVGIAAWTPEPDRPELRAHCDAIATAFARSDHPFQDSYPGMSWPADNVAAMASLARCSQLHDGAWDADVAAWVALARRHADPETGALTHSTRTGDAPRGSSLALMARLLADVDPAWARHHYGVLRERHVTTFGGLPAVLEYAGGVGAADIDSGPLPFGIGLAASAVTAGAAYTHGDDRLGTALLDIGEVIGLPVSWRGRKRYALGLAAVGEAFGVWSQVAPARTMGPGWSPPIPSTSWRLLLDGPFVLILLLTWLGPLARWRRSDAWATPP